MVPRVATVAVRRPSADILDPQIKSLNYLNLVMAKLEAKAAGADEALLLDVDGHVCEAPGYNVFAAREGVLITPERDILAGITRQTTLALAAELGVVCKIGRVTLYDLYSADEIMFTSTAGGMLPVVELDGRTIGDGRPGSLFRTLKTAYYDLLAGDRFGTPVYGDRQPAVEQAS
jgi:branched-chain amino acid aminotransferase